MTRVYLKQAAKTSATDAGDVRETVQKILDEIEAGGEATAKEYADRFDRYAGNLVLDRDEIVAAGARIPQRLRDDIRFAHDNVRRFAEAQMETLTDVELEVVPGLIAGQKSIPCRAAGCYVPGGRYSHIASAIMTVTTAKVAGCEHIAVCSPPRPDTGVHPAIVYTADLCGADSILALGGVQGVAAMAFGLFGLPAADILVGPGNQFVAEAKRILFGRVGIDMFAGPTDSLILADGGADPDIVAADLVGQAEHGYNSPVWLVTDDRSLAEEQGAVALQPGKPPVDVRSLDGEVLRRIVVGGGRHLLAVGAEDDLGIVAPGRGRVLAIHLRQIVDETRYPLHDRLGEGPVVGDQPHR